MMKYDHSHNCMLVLFLGFTLIFGFFGCSENDDPGKPESKAETTERASVKAIGIEELKQIYLVFIDEFTIKPFGQENEDRFSSNRATVSRAISELEGLSDTIQDPKVKEIHNKFLNLLREYNDAAPILENAISETKSAREDLNRREEEAKALAGADPWKYATEKQEIIKERSKLAEYGNIGSKKSKIESIETALYWLHKDFGIEGLKK